MTQENFNLAILNIALFLATVAIAIATHNVI